MKLNLLDSSRATRVALAFLFAATVAARADVEDKINKSFQVQPGGQLIVAVDRGSIDVKTADREVVDIEVIRKAGGSESKARAILNDHVVTTSQDGSRVELKAEFKGAKSSGWFKKSPELQVRFVISIPRKFDVNLKTAGGHIDVEGLAGTLQAATSGGHLNFKQIEGPITARTSGGHIKIAGSKGKVEISTSGGHLDLSAVEGDVTAKTSGGAIHADRITGRCVLKTSGGSIEVSALKGSVEAATSGGGIEAELIDQPAGDCSFKTSGGGITVTLGEKVAVDVDLHTSAGRLSTDFPVTTVFQGDKDKHELRGKINGGGPLITAHTSAGGVRLRKK